MMGSIPPICARGTFRRLTGANYSTGESFEYDYDKVGNRTATHAPPGTVCQDRCDSDHHLHGRDDLQLRRRQSRLAALAGRTAA